MNVNECKEIEKKKAYLRRYKKNLAKIKRLEEKVEYINERMINLRAIRITDEPRGTTSISKAELLSDKIEYEERIERLKIKSRQLRKEIAEAIDTLEEVRHIDVLEAFFLDCLTFEEISEKLGYTLRHTIHLYSEGIKRTKISLDSHFEN